MNLVTISLFSIISFLVAIIGTTCTSKDVLEDRTKARTIIGRALIIIAIIDCILSLIAAIYYYDLYHEADYSINLFRSSIFLFVSLFAWGKHILTYSKKELPIWKKTAKTIIYVIVNIIFFVSMNWNPSDYSYQLFWVPYLFIALMFFCAFVLSKLNQAKKQSEKQDTSITDGSEPKQVRNEAILEKRKKILKRIGLTIALILLITLCMFVQDGGSITGIMLICYLPVYCILLFWYIKQIWSEKTSGEKLLLLPLLNKVHLFNNYDGSMVMRKKLIVTVLPYIITVILCPLVVLVITSVAGKVRYWPYGVIVPILLIPPLILIGSIISVYANEWIYKKEG